MHEVSHVTYINTVTVEPLLQIQKDRALAHLSENVGQQGKVHIYTVLWVPCVSVCVCVNSLKLRQILHLINLYQSLAAGHHHLKNRHESNP